MYLHLGEDHIVNEKDVIGIFDLERTSVSKYTREFLSAATKNKRVMSCTSDLPKSFVVTLDKDYTEKVYVSLLACSTLKKRNQKSRF